MGWSTSGKGMVMEDKGMRQRDCCLCEYGCKCLRVLSIDFICVSLGVDDYRGLQILRGVCDWEGNGTQGL